MKTARYFSFLFAYAIIVCLSAMTWYQASIYADKKYEKYKSDQARADIVKKYKIKEGFDNIVVLLEAGAKVYDKNPNQAKVFFSAASELAVFDDPLQRSMLDCLKKYSLDAVHYRNNGPPDCTSSRTLAQCDGINTNNLSYIKIRSSNIALAKRC